MTDKIIYATEKQFKFMNQLGLDYSNPTMQEARTLIQNKLNEDEKDNIEREPVNPIQWAEDQAEKARVYDKHKVGTHVEKLNWDNAYTPPKETKSNGFKIKLTEENIRIGALTCAIEYGKGKEDILNWNAFMELVKQFEKYIRFGE